MLASSIIFLTSFFFKEPFPAIFFVISSFKDITEKLIPFFNKYPLIGDKNKSLEDFVTVVELMKENKHLTKNGLEKIKQIKAGMNKGRKIDK